MLQGISRKTTMTVGGAAVLLGLASLASRLVGILRDRLLSGTFGAGTELDLYYAAFRIPDMVYGLVVGGVVTAGFIPVFTRYLAADAAEDRGVNGDAARLADALLTLLGAVLAGGALVGAALAPWFVPRITPGFDPELMDRAVFLTRVMFLSPVFLGLSNVFGGILQSKRRFFVFAFAPVLYNLGIIGGTIVGAPSAGVLGPAAGVAVGAFLHLVAQILACRDAGYRFRPAWDPRHQGIVQIMKLTLPRFASLGSAQLNAVVVTGIASTLGAGSIAVITLATNLQQFPIGIIGVSFGVAAFPLIAELAAQDKRDEFAQALARATRHILFLIIPATVLILLLRAQIVRAVLGSGNFDWADTIATADTLAFFSLSLFSQALWPLLARACFALEDAMTPLYAVVAGIAVERTAAWALLARGMGVESLALASSVGSVFVILWIWVALRRKVGSFGEWAIVRSVGITSAAALAMAFVVQFTKTWIGTALGTDTFVRIFAQGAGAGLAGLAVFGIAAYLLGSEEVKNIVAMSRRRFATVPATDINQVDGGIAA
jgi:putative peptidoglycan lipid II flippase